MAIVLVLALAAATSSQAAGLLQPKNSELPALQIKDHKVRVVINNGYATTEVDQLFHNPHGQDLEAIYTFPLPRLASLSELSLWIDGQEVIGEVVEKERARRIYEEEKAAGRDAALTEMREYYSFDVFVSPVRAGADTRVRILYVQPLEMDTGVGRYVYPLEEGKIDEEVHEFWDLAPQVHGTFDFDCTIRSSYPLEAVRAKGYDSLAQVAQVGPDEWNVRITDEEGSLSLNRDVVVYYRLAKNQPARVDLLAHRDGAEPGTFLLVVTPGADLQTITEGVDWSIVLDISGSMEGKIHTAADAVVRTLDTLRPEDRFRIVAFANAPLHVVRDWTPVTPGSVDDAKNRLFELQPTGGTNLYGGFESGLKRMDADRTSALILVSDGGANVGPTEIADFLELLEKRDVRVFTFVMGQGANVPLLSRLAEESNGFSMDVSNQDDLYGRLLQAKAKLAREAMHGVKLELPGARVRELSPERIPSAYHGQQIALFGRYTKPGETELHLRARISGKERSWKTRIVLPENDTRYPELERMWALARVRELQKRIDDGGDRSELRSAIVDIGTEYSIVTDHTSMVVVQEERFEELGIERRNRDRVETERMARQTVQQQPLAPTRADQSQPMFGGRSAPDLGGGAAGPGLLGLLLALLGGRELARRRRRDV
jgi:Ca-activated chloride channel family protein